MSDIVTELEDWFRMPNDADKVETVVPPIEGWFHVEREGDCLYLSHDSLSLVGHGDTLLEAERDLLHDVQRTAAILTRTPASQLDPGAIRFRDDLNRWLELS